MPRRALSRLSAVECWKSKPSAFNVPACESVVGSRPSAMRLLRCVGLLRTLGSIELVSCSLVIEADHDVYWFARCVRIIFAPDTVDRYAGVNVYHCCPSPPSEKCGRKKYG